MPRIIDVDTEAFAPVYRKAQEPREARADTELRRMGTKMQLAGQALPLVGQDLEQPRPGVHAIVKTVVAVRERDRVP